jgi:hypothetical protein
MPSLIGVPVAGPEAEVLGACEVPGACEVAGAGAVLEVLDEPVLLLDPQAAAAKATVNEIAMYGAVRRILVSPLVRHGPRLTGVQVSRMSDNLSSCLTIGQARLD